MINTDLIKVLQNVQHLEHVGITFIHGGSNTTFISYHDLYRRALNCLSYLQRCGLEKGSELVIQLDNNEELIVVFWSCILGGIIPVPITVGQSNDHKQKLFTVWPVLNDPYIIAADGHIEKIEKFGMQTNQADHAAQIADKHINLNQFLLSDKPGNIAIVNSNDIAFIQFSSGSTGSPKGVVLTHGNLTTNVAAIAAAAEYTASDVMLSWMPLTHDMGLIGFHINPVYCGMNHAIMTTNAFVRRPALWFDKATELNATVLCSPNFGYNYILRHCADSSHPEWNLSKVRLLYNGAEPISVALCHEFLEYMEQFQLKKSVMCPVYGLAEASLAVSISDLSANILSINLHRDHLNFGDEVQEATDNTVAFVNVGTAINDTYLKITNEAGHEVGDGVIGHVCIQGKNVTQGYYNNPEATAKAIAADGWLNTGDLGFVKGGQLYITGRSKDIIFVNGQNYYPHDIERIAESVEGVELNKIAVAGYREANATADKTVAFVFHRGAIQKFVPLALSIKARINIETGIELDVLLPVRDIPRTTSGKLQRFKLLQQYTSGQFTEAEAQMATLLTEYLNQHAADGMPENATEQQLYSLVKAILKIERFGVNQHFFELGGNSLKGAELAMAVYEAFHVELTMKDLYANPTVRAMAALIDTKDNQQYQAIPQVPANGQVRVPLTAAQRRLYYAWQLNPQSIAYTVPAAFTISGEYNKDKLAKALTTVVARHDALHMAFGYDEAPYTMANPVASTVELGESTCAPEQVDDALKQLVLPFDLAAGALYRFHVVLPAGQPPVLLVTFHHIVTDGLSVHLFIEEVLQAYAGQPMAATKVKYADYALWEIEALKKDKIQAQASFWQQQLAGELPVLQLPATGQRPAVFNSNGARVTIPVDTALYKQLATLAKACNSSMHALLFTLYKVALWQYTGQHDVVVGIPVAGRKHPDVRYIHGMFVNNLAIRHPLAVQQTIQAQVISEQENLLKALDHQDYPFDAVLSLVDASVDASRNPVFDTMFVYQNMGAPALANAPITLAQHHFDPGFSKFDLTLEVFEYTNTLHCALEYATAIFSAEMAQQFAAHFTDLLQQASAEAVLAQLPLTNAATTQQLVQGFNNTAHNYPTDTTIHALITQQAQQTPNAVAVTEKGKSVTYAELEAQANHLTAMLQQNGVGAGSIVGLRMPASAAFVTSVLAVLKTGAAYLPIDVKLPDARVQYMLENSQATTVITSGALPATINLPGSVHVLDIQEFDLSKPVEPGIEPAGNASSLAYVIYTSGTTGNPKGVMVQHQSLVNYICWARDTYLNAQPATFALYTSISFDLTVTSLFTPLISGGTVAVYTEQEDSLVLEDIIADNQVEVIKVTPSHLKMLAAMPGTGSSKIKTYIVGGEKLEATLAQNITDLYQGQVAIYNEYGPTEATVGCMIHQYNTSDTSLSVPIGIPAANTRIYLLNEHGQPVPKGVHGQLYIAGTGLAQGYLHNERLTAERFIDDPFAEGQKMYNSGDIARMLPNGVLEFIGRKDEQVKLNGYRIELPEIEHHLATFATVEQGVVLVHENEANNSLLLAFYVATKGATVEPAVLRSHLSAHLPHYMVPAKCIEVPQIPLTNNGKVNYKALLQYQEQPATAQAQELPQSEIETAMCAAWQHVLGIEAISITDNFFELGGDSIKAVQIASRLQEVGIHIKAKDILTQHTIAQVSPMATTNTGKPAYEQGLVSGTVPVWPIAAWFLAQQQPNQNYYHQSVLLTLQQPVEAKLIAKAFGLLVNHHDALRLNYRAADHVFEYNNALANQPFHIDTITAAEPAPVNAAIEVLKQGIDISQGLQIKAALLPNQGAHGQLLIVMHHLVTDGITWRVLLEDLYRAYTSLKQQQAVQLPAKSASLIDWAQGLEQLKQSARQELSYWQVAAETPFNLPLDYVAPNWAVNHGSRVTRGLDEATTSTLLKKAWEVYSIDASIVLNVALAMALQQHTGHDTVVIEQENHGRHLDAIEAARTAGWFTALHPVRMQLPEGGIDQAIKAVKEQLKGIPGHGLGYGLLAMDEANGLPAYRQAQVRLNYLGSFGQELNNDLFAFEQAIDGYDTDGQNAMTARLDVNAIEVNNRLNITINFNTTAHAQHTVEGLADALMAQLNELLNHLNGQEDIQFTPSDFDAVSLDQDELDALFD